MNLISVSPFSILWKFLVSLIPTYPCNTFPENTQQRLGFYFSGDHRRERNWLRVWEESTSVYNNFMCMWASWFEGKGKGVYWTWDTENSWALPDCGLSYQLGLWPLFLNVPVLPINSMSWGNCPGSSRGHVAGDSSHYGLLMMVIGWLP